MDSSDQLVLMLVIILALGLAYVGVNFWSKRMAASKDSSGSAGTGVPAHLSHLEDETEAVESTSQTREKRTQKLDLTGARAEMAAKVLKRMLKDDGKGPR